MRRIEPYGDVMHFENMFWMTFVISLCLFFLFILPKLTSTASDSIRQRIKAATLRTTVKRAKAKLAAEEARIAQLPRLDKRWLIRVPGSHDGRARALARTFDSRYHRILLYDEDGNPWIGLLIPSVIEGLRKSEYAQGKYWIPVRGAGESFYGEPVTIDGLEITVYPEWMRPGVNPMAWESWAEIEREYARYPSYTETLERVYRPYQEEIEEKAKKRRDLQRAAIA